MKTHQRWITRTSFRLAAVLAIATACAQPATEEPDAGANAEADTGARAGDVAPPSSAQLVADSLAFTTRVVVLMEAMSAQLDSLKARTPEDDYYVIADDLMYYRASAVEYFEGAGIPVVRLEGRHPVRFEIDGAMRTYDYADEPTFDLLVLYDPGREPLPVATADLHLAQSYFDLQP